MIRDQPVAQRKRLNRNWEQVEFPKRNGQLLKDMNFLPYARTHDTDVILTNGAIEFEAHKKILCACAPGIKDIINGDSEATEIPLRNLPDDAFTLLRDIIYSTPNGRDNIAAKLLSQAMICLELIEKYDITIVREILEFALVNYFFRNGGNFTKFANEARRMNLENYAVKAKSMVILNRRDVVLSTCPPYLIADMIEAHDFGTDFKFFEMCVEWLKEFKDTFIFEKLYKITDHGQSFKKKFQMEQRKTRALLNCVVSEK